jgi:hypothetical protein
MRITSGTTSPSKIPPKRRANVPGQEEGRRERRGHGIKENRLREGKEEARGVDLNAAILPTPGPPMERARPCWEVTRNGA